MLLLQEVVVLVRYYYARTYGPHFVIYFIIYQFHHFVMVLILPPRTTMVLPGGLIRVYEHQTVALSQVLKNGWLCAVETERERALYELARQVPHAGKSWTGIKHGVTRLVAMYNIT